MSKELTCKEFINFIVDFLSDELRPAKRVAFEQHLEVCADCVNYLASYEQTIRIGREVCSDDDTLPADIPETLVDAILQARRAAQDS